MMRLRSKIGEFMIFVGVRVIEPDAFNGLDTVGLLKLAFMDLQALQMHTFHNLIRVHILTIQVRIQFLYTK